MQDTKGYEKARAGIRRSVRKVWAAVASLAFALCLSTALAAQNSPNDPKVAAAPSRPAENRATFTQAPPAAPAKVLPRRRHYVLPDSDCTAEASLYFAAPKSSPASVQPHSNELIEPADRVQELPDERVQAMPRVGED